MIAAPALDDQTAVAIRDAVRAARAGRLGEASEICGRALASGGDRVALNALIGTLHCRAGEHLAGISHLRTALAERPTDVIIAGNLASALAATSDYAGALEILSEDLVLSDPSMRLGRLRGFCAQMTEDFATAIACYERVVASEPEDWESWNNLGNSRRSFGDFQGSVDALERAVLLTPDSPPVRLNHAMAVASNGDFDEAERLLRRIAEDFPHDANPLRELHVIMKGRGQDGPALEAIEEAVRRAPDDSELRLALASHCLNMMQTDAAENAYRHVLSMQPSNDLANLGLAVVFELSNRTKDLADLVEEAERRDIGKNGLNFIRAMDHRRAGRFLEGLAALECVPEDLESTRRYHLLGQLHEGAGNYDQAFEAFSRMNAWQSQDPTRPADRASGYRESLRLQLATVTPAWVRRWVEETPKPEQPSPAFLVGFPRSGTTLLDTMLMGHPDIDVLEEEPTLIAAAKRLQPFEGLPTASDSQIRAARGEYYRVAAERIQLTAGKLLIDKNPLSMNLLPLIHRLFPGARIILAMRHPCDVVVSSYTSNFKLNEGMSSFLDLNTTAELYDLSFRYFEQSQELIGFPIHKVIYERLIADRERELGSVLDFLGLQWSDEVLDHESTAKTRGRVKTASYAQVFEPIYTRSAGRWQNYRKYLAPVLPILEPWVKKFGYSL